MKIKLPCHERYFSEAAIGPTLSFTRQGHDNEDNRLDSPRDESAFMIRLCDIRLAVLSSANDDCAIPPWQEGSKFARLWEEMQRLEQEIDAELPYSSTSMFQKRRQGRIVAFTVLHVLVQQVMCDLHQVDHLQTGHSTTWSAPTDFFPKCRLERLSRAVAMCGILADASQHKGIAFDPFTGTCAYQACKILVYGRVDALMEMSEGMTQQIIENSINSALECMRRGAKVSQLILQSVSLSWCSAHHKL